MKKYLAVVLCLLMVIGLAACGAKTEAEPQSEAEKIETGAEGGPIGNPVTEVESLEALNEMTGAKFVTPGVMGVTNVFYSIIDCGDYKIASYKYTVNDKVCEIRFSDYMQEDISGYYLEDGTAFAASEGDDEIIKDGVGLARWFTVDGQYVYIVESEGIDKELFDAFAYDFRNASLGDNGPAALAAFYSSIEGEYGDPVSQRASLTVTANEDNAEFTVLWSSSASATTKWVMHIRKTEDGLLNYKDCVKTVITDDGEKTESENGEGYFEYSEGKLLWTGAAEEDCTVCAFEMIPATD